MSRRITLLVLAASAALIATPAFADPECFGETCHLPGLAEPPLPDTNAEQASEASASVEKPAPVKALPQAVLSDVALPQPVTAAPAKAPVNTSQALATPSEPQPLARRPLPKLRVTAEAVAPREPVALAPRALKEAPALAVEMPPVPAGYARSARVTSTEPSYVVGYNAPPVAGVVVVVPGMAYAAGHRPVYMFAPGAKIISIDSDD